MVVQYYTHIVPIRMQRYSGETVENRNIFHLMVYHQPSINFKNQIGKVSIYQYIKKHNYTINM